MSDVVPDGETYNFLIYMAAGGPGDGRELRGLPFGEFARLLGMRMARTVLTTDAKHLIKTK